MNGTKISVYGLYLRAMATLSGSFVLGGIILLVIIWRLMSPFFISEQARLVRDSVKEQESTLVALILRQEYSSAYNLVANASFVGRAEKKDLRLFSLDQYSKYQLKTNCFGSFQHLGWGAQCIESGKMIFEIPVKFSDNTLAHLHITLKDTILEWKPFQIVGACIAVLIILALLLPLLFTRRFRRTFAVPLKQAMARIDSLEHSDTIEQVVSEVPLKEVYQLAKLIIAKQLNLQSANKKIVDLEFRNEALKMASKIAHDIKGPIASIGGVLAREPLSSEANGKIRSLLARIASMIDEHLNQIKQIGRFDEMAPPEAFRNRSMDECHKSNLSPVGAAILSALSDSSGLATAHSIRINRILSKEIYYTFTTTDFYILYRCIINLLINAIEATKSQQQREITIYAASNKDNCEVIIKDTGPGFRPEVLQTLSENRSLSTKSNTSGGFGLLNTKQNIEGFGGRLIINSDETGSTIRILLPIAQTPNWFQNVLQFDRIDIVSLDDDIYFQKGLEKHFANCRVFPVGNEDDFLRLLAENSSAFGFVDFDFAGSMDGISFISKNNLQQRTTLVSDCIFADPSCFRRAIENEVRLFPKACFPFGFGPSWGTLRLANNEETT